MNTDLIIYRHFAARQRKKHNTLIGKLCLSELMKHGVAGGYVPPTNPKAHYNWMKAKEHQTGPDGR